MKKCIAILLYLFLIAAFLKFDISLLFDAKQFFLVILGAGILYLPMIEKKSKIKFDRSLFSKNALWASLLQTFALLFFSLPKENSNQLALACRPLLYGFCIWIIFHAEEDKLQQDKSDIEQNKNHEKEDVDNQINVPAKEVMIKTVANAVIGVMPDAEECRKFLAEKGLTKREVEVAMLAVKRMSNAEIAGELFISETTVKKHLSNIFAKLEINKREQIEDVIKK